MLGFSLRVVPMYAIEINNLVKRFGSVVALNEVSFTINDGEFFGLLGPNGAGKTTLIRILTTLLRPTSGRAMIMGIDVEKDKGGIRKLIGVVPQAMTSDLDLTGWENMDIYARFYNMPLRERRNRIEYLLDMVGLWERKNDLVATYSGGMRRRLEIAKGLVHRPSILILDEPTIGLDPQSRHVVWELLTNLHKEDKLTVLLTTHYMEEAEFLCGRIAIIDYGKIVAIDTIEGLKRVITTKDIVEVTLEDVFIHFTGRPIREEEAKKFSFFIGAGIPQKWGR